jgi:cytidine deaminase
MLDKDKKQELVQAAIKARRGSYSPYSNYAVGAALLTRGGQVFLGANVENAVFPMSICAERVAVFKAVTEGQHEFSAIAVATHDGGTPCGACRQVLAEFGLDTLVIIADDKGKIYHEMTVDQLLPESFGPQNLLK